MKTLFTYSFGLLSVAALLTGQLMADETRKMKHETEWRELVDQLKKYLGEDVEMPKTPGDMAALQARTATQILVNLDQIQNSIVSVNPQVNVGDKQDIIIALLQEIKAQVAVLHALTAQIQKDIGSPSDPSLSATDLPDLTSVDQSTATIFSWLKTIYREIKQDFPS